MSTEEFKNLLLALINKAQDILENNLQELERFPGIEIGENVLSFLDVTLGSYDTEKCEICKKQYRSYAEELWKTEKNLNRCAEILNWTRLFLEMQADEEQSLILQNKDFCQAGLSLMAAMTESEWWDSLECGEEDTEKRELLLQVRKKGCIGMLNFEGEEKYSEMEIPLLWDDSQDLYYSFYSGKKLYFPAEDDPEKWKDYMRDILAEQNPRSAHCYRHPKYEIKPGDIILDIGAAEGNFSLEHIEKAGHIYIAEPEEKWLKPLQATFAQYLDKITFVQKFIGQEDTENRITIDRLVGEGRVDFIKMDIEGAELDALKGAEYTLRRHHPTCAICTYHHEGDAERIDCYLKKWGYETSYSNGYIGPTWNMEFWGIDDFINRRLRRGVLFAAEKRIGSEG